MVRHSWIELNSRNVKRNRRKRELCAILNIIKFLKCKYSEINNKQILTYSSHCFDFYLPHFWMLGNDISSSYIFLHIHTFRNQSISFNWFFKSKNYLAWCMFWYVMLAALLWNIMVFSYTWNHPLKGRLMMCDQIDTQWVWQTLHAPTPQFYS